MKNILYNMSKVSTFVIAVIVVLVICSCFYFAALAFLNNIDLYSK